MVFARRSGGTIRRPGDLYSAYYLTSAMIVAGMGQGDSGPLEQRPHRLLTEPVTEVGYPTSGRDLPGMPRAERARPDDELLHVGLKAAG